MDYFAGLDVSMEETHICIVDRDGTVTHDAKAASSPAAIAAALAKMSACTRVVFETGRMAPMLYQGLVELGVPVVCIESRQAYQALKSLATHKTDRNDSCGPAHLARNRLPQTGACEVAAGPCRPLADPERDVRFAAELGHAQRAWSLPESAKMRRG